MNVQELLEQQYGVKTVYETNPLVPQLEASPVITRFLPYNPRRLSFVLVNLSAVYICVGPDSNVSLTRGIYLVPNGGTLSMVWTEDFEMPTFEWYGLANGAAAEIYVLEVLTQ